MLKKRAIDRLRARRQLLLASFDSLMWGAAISLADLARLDFHTSAVHWSHVGAAWLLVAAFHLTFGWFVRLHHGRAALATLEEMMLLGAVTAAAGTVLFTVNFSLNGQLVPRSVPVVAIFIAVALMSWGRASWRRLSESERQNRLDTDVSVRVVILGAGDGARQLIRSMRGRQQESWQPVALLDDDRRKRHLRLYGVPVLGTSEDLARVSAETEASVLVVAIPSADATLIRRVTTAASEIGVKVKVVPAISELLHERVDIHDVRDVNLSDVLGRRPVDTDLESIASYLTDQRVLVTGAGGSIGSELCRQIHQWRPAELIMVDRDESALHAVQLSIHGRALLDSPDLVLGDIREAAFVDALFAVRRPHVVFHAAALKHLPILEQYPGEAVKTNVWGTATMLDASERYGVERFVNISTDKAANPCSVLGYSKRVAEGLTAAMGAAATGQFLSVRFGNVLGSRGSVLDTFTAQIAADLALTVTHPEVTRFFMTIQEAVELVIQAAAIGGDGQALVLDMGEAVRINDVARQLISMSGKRLGIEYTGMRQGEKMHEELFGQDELDDRPVHPLVSHVNVPRVDPVDARALDPWAHHTTVTAALAKLCNSMGSLPTFQRANAEL